MQTTTSLLGVAAIAASTPAAILEFHGHDPLAGTSFTAMTNSQAARAEFLSHLSGATTQDFGSGGGPTFGFGAAGNATLGGEGSIFTSNSGGRFSTSAGGYWRAAHHTGQTHDVPFSIAFSAPTSDPGVLGFAAIGFYATDIDTAASLIVETAAGLTHTIAVSPGASGYGGGVFFGIIATDLNDLFVNATLVTAEDDTFGLDDLTIASFSQVQSIPFPPAAAAGGLAMLPLLARRRRA